MASGASRSRVRRRSWNARPLATSSPLSRLDAVLRRAARDLLVIAVASDDDAERVVRDLQRRGYRLDAIVEQETTRRLATARLAPPEEPGVVLDALFASSGIEPEIAREADALEILPGLRVPVATTGHLIALKILARDDRTRPQDRVDLVALTAAAGRADVEQARAALTLIAQRGFHRGKNLVADLEEFSRLR